MMGLALAVVTVVLNGFPVRGYIAAVEVRGRIFAPVRPYVTRIADRTWFLGDRFAIERDGRTVYIRLPARHWNGLERTYVPLGKIARALRMSVTYDRISQTLCIRTVALRPVASPSPFDGRTLPLVPSEVFTPIPVPTVRPVYIGPPLPRRTPLPVAAPTGHPAPDSDIRSRRAGFSA
ncbi:MAG: hypothetical protein M3R51_00570 [Candidatus Eremiobacteraeota bacterium]|nr:hypothetical protein [Candidatus Eremiobacteraeota bacterium]